VGIRSVKRKDRQGEENLALGGYKGDKRAQPFSRFNIEKRPRRAEQGKNNTILEGTKKENVEGDLGDWRHPQKGKREGARCQGSEPKKINSRGNLEIPLCASAEERKHGRSKSGRVSSTRRSEQTSLRKPRLGGRDVPEKELMEAARS